MSLTSEAYLDPNNSVFRDFVDEYIFILRNTFEIPDDHDRFNLLLEEVLSGPVLYHEYKQLMTEEVSHPRFFWGVSSYAELDVNGDGMITTNEIGKTSSLARVSVTARNRANAERGGFM